MKKSLVIVAHPDDETIWMGGTILKNKSWKWTIISLCRANDSDRMPKFKEVCAHYGAEAIIGDLDDEKLEPLSAEEIISKIKKLLPSDEYDYVFTHGENGEYGHIRHREVHLAVKKMIKEKEIKCKKVFYFSYKPSDDIIQNNQKIKIALPDKEAKQYFVYDDKILNDKIMLITKSYGFQNESFEAISCNRAEAFNNK